MIGSLRWRGVGLDHSRKAPGPELAGVVRLASAVAPASLGVPRFPLQPTLAASFVDLDLHAVSGRRTGTHGGHQISAQQGLLLRHYVKNSPHCAHHHSERRRLAGEARRLDRTRRRSISRRGAVGRRRSSWRSRSCHFFSMLRSSRCCHKRPRSNPPRRTVVRSAKRTSST